jgi:GNAT superfamily N-acetyltransferase
VLCDLLETMSSVRIRLAVSSEQKALEALQRRASLTNAGDREAVIAHPDAIELPIEQIETGAVFVAEWNGVVAGFAAILPRADGATELDGLFVEPDVRRRGIGRLLVEHCSNIALRRGSTALHVVGNRHAEVFYRECGFELIGTADTRFGSALLLRKRLPAVRTVID